jgi:hypothetical protein
MRQNGKQIWMLTLAGIILVTIATYSFAIKKTIDTISNCNAMTHTLDSANLAPQYMQSLQQEIELFSKNIGNSNISDMDFQISLIQVVGDYCKLHGMTVQSFPNPHVFTKEKFQLQTYRFTVAGNYAKHVQLLQMLEHRNIGAKIVSVHFETQKQFQQHRELLAMTVYLQKIHDSHE